MTHRPSFITNYRDHLTPTGEGDLAALASSLGKVLGLKRIGIHVEIVPPGHRTSLPHAESHEEEFVYVLSGLPSAWINGVIHDLYPGDAVAFPAGTGIAHTILNNSSTDTHLLVIGETTKPENRIYYPLDPDRRAKMAEKGLDWTDAPHQQLGSHNGKATKGTR